MKLCMWNTKQNKSKRLLRKKNIEKKKKEKKSYEKAKQNYFFVDKKKHEITKIGLKIFRSRNSEEVPCDF